MKRILTLTAVFLLGACSAEPGSEKWCAATKEKPKGEWSTADATTYTKNCLIDGSEVGSEKWCEKLSDKPKGEWTGNETKTYAKYCVM